MLKLSKEQIEKLKNKANEYQNSDSSDCVFTSRLEPPFPKQYFGCTVLPVVTTTPTLGDIVSKPLGYTTKKLREVIEKVTNEYIRSCFAILKSEPDLFKIRYFHIVGSSQGAFYGNPNMCITNWT
ncbi:hypothetical protein ACSBR1_025746 [Camellia fascicularis]